MARQHLLNVLVGVGLLVGGAVRPAEAGLFGRRAARGGCCGRVVRQMRQCCPPCTCCQPAPCGPRVVTAPQESTPKAASAAPGYTCAYKCKASDPFFTTVFAASCAQACAVAYQDCSGPPQVPLTCAPPCPPCGGANLVLPPWTARQLVKFPADSQPTWVVVLGDTPEAAVAQLLAAKDVISQQRGQGVNQGDVRVKKHR